MQVGEIATETGVSVRSIRYYERAGLLRATRRPNGYREFERDVVTRVRAIRNLLETGFTIEEVVSLSDCLECSAKSANCCAKTKAVYSAKLAKINAQVSTLTTLRERIEKRINVLGTC